MIDDPLRQTIDMVELIGRLRGLAWVRDTLKLSVADRRKILDEMKRIEQEYDALSPAAPR